MATDLLMGDIFALSVRSTFLGQPVVNTIHLSIVSPTVVAGKTVQEACNNLLITPNVFTELLAEMCSAELVMREVSAQLIYRVGSVYPGSTFMTYRKAINIPGNVVGAPLPGQPSITLSTYGQFLDEKAMRGGIRVAGIVEESLEDGLLMESFLSTFAAEITSCFLSQWVLGESPDQIYYQPVIFSLTSWTLGRDSIACAIDQTAVRRVPGTVRRRKEYSSQGGYPV